jgi:uncharacterized membrane protein
MTIVGIVLAIMAAFMGSYSLFIQKRELNSLPRLEGKDFFKTLKAFVSCRPWLAAQALAILGTTLHAIALGMAPMTIVQTINTSGIVVLALLAIYKLGEEASLIDWVGIGSILLGLVFMAVTMTAKTDEFYYNPLVLWFLVVFLLGSSLLAFFNGMKKKSETAPIFIAVGTAILVGTNAIWIKVGMQEIWGRFWDQNLGAALSTPYLYVIVIFAVGTQILQQVALQRGKAIIVMPIINGISNLIPIIVGVIVFHERWPTSGFMIVLRLISIVMVIGGAILLSLGKE